MSGYLRGVYERWIDFPLREGRRLGGRYEIIRFLGVGSYGLTYLCRDERTDAEVVLKQAKPSKGALGRELLRREHDILRALAHEQIPACWGMFEEGKRLCLVMEHIGGATAEELLFDSGRCWDERESLLFIRRLMQVVGWIHEQGYVHLDLRIPNVMVTGGGAGELYVIDFGLARQIGDTRGFRPEGSGDLPLRRAPYIQSDLYAAGHFLLFLLYSAYPAESPHLGEEAGWEEELELSERTRRIIKRLLQEEPPYESTGAFLTDLDRALE